MFSKWRHRDLHSLRKATQLGTGTRMQIQESGANVWVPDPSLYHDKTSLGANPHAEPQEDSMAACSLLVSLHGWPVPQTSPRTVSRRRRECGTSVHLLRPVLITVLLCAHLNVGKKIPKFSIVPRRGRIEGTAAVILKLGLRAVVCLPGQLCR